MRAPLSSFDFCEVVIPNQFFKSTSTLRENEPLRRRALSRTKIHDRPEMALTMMIELYSLCVFCVNTFLYCFTFTSSYNLFLHLIYTTVDCVLLEREIIICTFMWK
jgi:hypothetical protein